MLRVICQKSESLILFPHGPHLGLKLKTVAFLLNLSLPPLESPSRNAEKSCDSIPLRNTWWKDHEISLERQNPLKLHSLNE